MREFRPRYTLPAVSQDDTTSLWIIGAGPSALALADACCARGVRVGIVAPAPTAPWTPNYALWRDDAAALGVDDQLAASWPRARAYFAGGRGPVLERGYALLDDASLQREWLARGRERGLRIVAAEVAAIEHDDEGVALRCAGGETLRGRLVVDASGHRSRFIARERAGADSYQVAWGELWTLEAGADARFDPAEVVFMDWRPASADEAADGLPPTFLYALPRGDGRVFVEETILAAALEGPPSRYFPALRERLHARLDGLGLGRVEAEPLEIERCIIPMGAPLPLASQRTLAFGGAASMVHPATGYLLTTVLRRRERVAAAIADELDAWVGPGGPSRRIWRAIWTTSEVQAWRLYGFGLGILSQLDRAGLDTFFAEFFALGDVHWRGFVSADAPSPKLMATMLRYYATVPRSIRARLSSALVGREGLRMFRGFTGLAS